MDGVIEKSQLALARRYFTDRLLQRENALRPLERVEPQDDSLALTFEPHGSQVVVFRKERSAVPLATPRQSDRYSLPVGGIGSGTVPSQMLAVAAVAAVAADVPLGSL